MSSRNETMRARERLHSAAPVCDDASLLKLQEEVAEYVRKAKRRDTRGPDEVVSKVADAVARKYFQHAIRTKSG
jgi:hypothetical protein